MQPNEKDFLLWHTEKSRIQNNTYRPYFKEKEIWWCSIGFNIGHEEDGKGLNFRRPVLVLKKFNHFTFWGIPLSSKPKLEGVYQAVSYDNCKSTALLPQLRLFDSQRLGQRMSILSDYEFYKIKKTVKEIL